MLFKAADADGDGGLDTEELFDLHHPEFSADPSLQVYRSCAPRAVKKYVC